MAAPAETHEAARVEQIQDHLLGWYASHKRDLPWRRTRDPYAILVAEVMLQQTQVDRVIPKWHAWLEQFPTFFALARASRADAIRAWQGLGYNLRAVRLRDIARQVVAEYGGELPRSVESLLTLKGIGRYTAGAVACFAYEQPVAMVDTNVRRVLSRALGVEPTRVAAMADALVPRDAAYAWSQALMDLGATLCRVRRPLCLVCPLVAECGGPRAPEVKASQTAKPVQEFRGSRRYYRGRLVDYLRRLPMAASMSLDDLVLAVAPRGDLDVVSGLVRQLVADGLLSEEPDGRLRLSD